MTLEENRVEKKLEDTKLVVLAAKESIRRTPGVSPPLSRAVPFYSIIMQMLEWLSGNMSSE